MRFRSNVLAGTIFMAGCSGSDGDSSSAPITAPAPAPTPAPTPGPTPTPTPTPTPAPTYLSFDQLFGNRTFQSACTGATLPGLPPAVMAPTAFGRGLVFVSIPTPQIRSVTGDGLTLTFTPQDIDAGVPAPVIAYLRTVGDETQRFSISRPAPGGVGLDYARFAQVSLARAATTRLYQCVIGIPTLANDLPTMPLAYPRAIVAATAYVRDAATTRSYSIDRSQIGVTADFAARRVTLSGTLIGTPAGGNGPELALGTISAVGAIDAAGAFTADLVSGDRTLAGGVSGRFFGPQASEIGLVLSAEGPETARQSAFSLSGSVYLTR